MAISLLPFARRRPFSSFTRDRLLLSLCLALLLLPCLLSLHLFLLYRSSLLSPAPIFLLSNFLILAIVLSSASSPLPPPPVFVLPSFDDIPRFSELPSQALSNRRLSLRALRRTKQQQPQLLRSSPQPLSSPVVLVPERHAQALHCSVPASSGSWQSPSLVTSSVHPADEGLPTILRTRSATTLEPETKQSLASAPSASADQPAEQFAVKESATDQHSVAASTCSRTNSHERRFDNAAESTKFLRATDAMGSASIAVREGCENRSSMMETHLPPIESLSDEDANKRFSEFIAKFLATMKKETLECSETIPHCKQYQRQCNNFNHWLPNSG